MLNHYKLIHKFADWLKKIIRLSHDFQSRNDHGSSLFSKNSYFLFSENSDFLFCDNTMQIFISNILCDMVKIPWDPLKSTKRFENKYSFSVFEIMANSNRFEKMIVSFCDFNHYNAI